MACSGVNFTFTAGENNAVSRDKALQFILLNSLYIVLRTQFEVLQIFSVLLEVRKQ